MTIATRRLFTIEEYHQLEKLGFLGEDDHVELIRGEIIQMAAKKTLHTACCIKLNRELGQLLGRQASIRCQDPILLPSQSEPEPDFVIAYNKEDDYLSSHPIPRDIILVIEIADSSLKYDQKIKIPLYAEAQINHYWIFNLSDNQLETYSQPYQKNQGDFAYSSQQIFLPNQKVNLPIFTDLVLDLTLIFPGN